MSFVYPPYQFAVVSLHCKSSLPLPLKINLNRVTHVYIDPTFFIFYLAIGCSQVISQLLSTTPAAATVNTMENIPRYNRNIYDNE